MDSNMVYTWVLASSVKPGQMGYKYEGQRLGGPSRAASLGSSLGSSLRRGVEGFVAIWDAMGRAVTTSLKSYTYCTSHPAECPA
jgi:hypothetical protein